MRFSLSAILLFPILIIQGLYVRRFTPKLPEAQGLRKSDNNTSKDRVNLLILGDSAAAGVGAAKQQQALTGQILQHLNIRDTVNWKLAAKTGNTTQDTLNLVNSMNEESFDAVVLSLGVNDVTSGVTPEKWLQFQYQLVATLESKFNCQLIIHSAVPPIHLFTALPQPLRWFLGKEAKCLNNKLRTWILSEKPEPSSKQHLVEFQEINDPTLLAEDGFHPSEKLYAIWGKQVADLLNAKL